MTTDSNPIDISGNPELLRLAEEVETTQKPRRLIRESKTVAILMPPPARDKKPGNTKVDYDAFQAAFGSWNDVDTETLLKNISADRRRTNSRPSIKL